MECKSFVLHGQWPFISYADPLQVSNSCWCRYIYGYGGWQQKRSTFNSTKSMKISQRNIIEGITKTASNFSHSFFVSRLFLRLRNWNCKCELSTSFCLLLSRCCPWNWHNEIPSGCSASKNMSVNWIWAKNFNRQIEKKKNGTEELCECNQPSDSAKFRAKSELPHLLGMFFWKSSA